MTKRIAYFIVGASAVLAIIMSAYLYLEHSRVEIVDIGEAELVSNSDEVTILNIGENDGLINISGCIEEDEPIMTVDLAIVLWDDAAGVYYKIPTEFAEAATEEEVDMFNRRKAGFEGSFAPDRLEGKTGGLILCVYDQNNGKKRLHITNHIL